MPKFAPGLRAVCVAIVASALFVASYRTASWLAGRGMIGKESLVYLKVLFAVIFTFAFERNLKKVGLCLPPREIWLAGVCLPVLGVLVLFESAGLYAGWNRGFAMHYFWVAVAEELFFRGCLLARLRPIGVLGSAALSSLIFAACHFSGFFGFWNGHFERIDWPYSAVIFLLGLFLAGVRLYSVSLYPCIVLHFLINYMQCFALPNFNYFARLCAHLFHQPGMEVEAMLWIWTLNGFLLTYGCALLAMRKWRDSREAVEGSSQ